MKKNIFAMLAVCGLAACATTTGTKVDTTKLDQLTPGVTTMAQAEQLLGQPTGISKNPDGTTTLAYFYSSNGQDAKTFIPLVGGFLGKSTSDSSMTYLQFTSGDRYMKWWGGRSAP